MFFEKLNDFLYEVLNGNIQQDEYYLANFKEENISNLETYEAFDILKSYIKYIIILSNQELSFEIVDILIDLRGQANTNEKPYSEKDREIIYKIYAKDEYEKSALDFNRF